MPTHDVLAVIPARYQSSRFPGKPLADRTGKPLIQHVIEQVRQSRRLGRIIVATDDQRIFDAVRHAGCEAAMTRSDHPNGTSRIAQVVQQLPAAERAQLKAVVNVQGDEPEIDPAIIDQLVDALLTDPDSPMATLACPLAADEDPINPNIVKLVLDVHRRALYFSRSLIPHDRDGRGQTLLRHLGLYAYRPDFLLHYVTLPATPLEQLEQLEQLRALEHGFKIAVTLTDTTHAGIDTPEQYEAFVQRVMNATTQAHR